MTPDFEVIVQTRRTGGTPEQCAEAAGISLYTLQRYIAEPGSRVDVYADAAAEYYQQQHFELAANEA